jgi:rhamnosyl/mannosyltransferase
MLGSAMRRLIADEEFARQCGRRARARYEELFSGPALGSAYADLYRSLVK